jgi:hypothetical protein
MPEQLPEITEIQRLTVKPGDRLIIRTDEKLSYAQARRLAEVVRERLGVRSDVRVAVLANGMSMEVAEGL